MTHPSSPSHLRASGSERRVLAAIAVGALAVRVAFALLTDRADLGFNDQFVYHHLADGLSRGIGYAFFDEPTLRWPPAFPFLLSLVYRVAGVDITAALLLNALLSALAVPLVHWCARPVVGRRAALAAAAVVALLPGQWMLAGTILSEPLATVQILLVVGLVVRHRPGPAVAAVLGLLIGWASLTRGEGPLLGLVVIVGWWPHLPRRRMVGSVALTAALAVAVITPWIVRNSQLAGRPTGVSINSAETLYAGHNPKADGGATYADSEVLAPIGSRPFGVEREIAQADLLQRLAVDWAKAHPGEELLLVPKRLVHLAEGDGNLISVWIEASAEPVLGRARGPLEVLADVTWYVLAAALATTLVVRRSVLGQPWARVALLLPALSLVLYGVLLYGNFRYRLPYEPLLVLVVATAWLPVSPTQR